MPVYSYTEEAPRSDGYLGIRTAVSIDGRLHQKYFELSRRGMRAAKDLDDVWSAKAQTIRTTRRRQAIPLLPSKHSWDIAIEGVRITVRGPSVVFTSQYTINGKGDRITKSIKVVKDTLDAKWTEILRFHMKSMGHKRMPSHWTMHKPSFAQIRALVRYYGLNYRDAFM